MLIVSLEPASIPAFKVEGWVGEDRFGPARRWIIPSRAVVAEQSRPQAHWRKRSSPRCNHVEVDMPISVQMKVILSPPGLILKERPRTEAGFTKTQAAAK